MQLAEIFEPGSNAIKFFLINSLFCFFVTAALLNLVERAFAVTFPSEGQRILSYLILLTLSELHFQPCYARLVQNLLHFQTAPITLGTPSEQ